MLIYLTGFTLLLPKGFFNEVILVEMNQRIKVPALEFCEFLRFIGIWMSMTANPGMNLTGYFSENSVNIFCGCSIHADQFMSGNSFESIFYDINLTPPPQILIQII